MRLLLLLTFIVFGTFSFAQNEDNGLQDSTKTVVKAPVNITSPRFNSNLYRNPDTTVTSYLKSANESLPNLDGLLFNKGLVFVQQSQLGGGSPVIRGFEANRVLLVVDGVRLNNSIYRSGHLQNLATIDQNTIEQANLEKGPKSLLYGSDAMGGAIILSTRTLKYSDDKSFNLKNAGIASTYSSATNHKQLHIDFMGGTNRVSTYTSFTYKTLGDLNVGNRRTSKWGNLGTYQKYQTSINGVDSVVSNSNNTINRFTGYNQIDGVFKVGYRISDNNEVVLNTQISQSSNVPRTDRLVNYNGSTPAFAEWYYGPQKRQLVSLNFRNTTPTTLTDKIYVIASSQFVEESRYSRRFRSSNLGVNIEQVQVNSLDLDFEKRISRFTFLYGIQYSSESVKSTAFNENVKTNIRSYRTTRYPDGRNTYNWGAAFINISTKVNAKLNVNAGLRLSAYKLNANFNDTLFRFVDQSIRQETRNLCGSLKADYRLSNKLSIFGSIGNAFRNPNIDDIGKINESNAQNKLVTVPNSNINPENLFAADLGFLVRNNWIKFEVEGYASFVKGLVATNASTFNGSDSIFFDGVMSKVVTNTNLDDALVYGIESECQVTFPNSFQLLTRVSTTKGKYRNRTASLDHIPPLFAYAELSYSLKRLYSSISVLYNAKKPSSEFGIYGEDNLNYTLPSGAPSWYVFNFNCRYQFNKRMTLIVGVENLLDQYYRRFASGVDGAGRSFNTTLKINL